MSDVIPFPNRRDPFGETIQTDAVRAGLAQVSAHGLTQADLQAVMDYDRPLATHLLQLLGSRDVYDRKCGALGLARLISTMKAEADEPQPAA